MKAQQQAERSKRHAEEEVGDIREAIAEMTTANSMLSAEKRRMEGDLRGMQQEGDNLMAQMKNSEEKTRKAMADAGKFTARRHVVLSSNMAS